MKPSALLLSCFLLFTLMGCAHHNEPAAHVPLHFNQPAWIKNCAADLPKNAICEVGYAEVLGGESYMAEEEARLSATGGLTKQLQNRLVVLVEKTQTLKKRARKSQTQKQISELAMTQMQGVRTDRRHYEPNRLNAKGVYVRVWLVPDEQQLQSSLEEMFEVMGKEPAVAPEVKPEVESETAPEMEPDAVPAEEAPPAGAVEI